MAVNDGSGERVLLVDTDPGHADTLKAHLGESGDRLVRVASADEALRDLAGYSPTVAVIDAQARTADGRNVVEALRAGGEDLPILVMGDPDHAAEFQRLLALGKVWYIARHAEWPHFERTFQTVVARGEAERTL